MDHLPFNTLEAGFDDNKYETIYRTIYFQVAEVRQQEFLELLNSDSVLTSDQLSAKQSLLKNGLTAQDYIKQNRLKIDPEFLFTEDTESVSPVELSRQLELFSAVLNGFKISGKN
jgi:hypothetical protein